MALAGVEQQVPYLAGRLRYSGAIYVECFPTERQECFLLGQRHAFEFWGGVPQQAVYDNLKPAVAAILAGHSRREQAAFSHFKSVYGFEAVFANPAAGWEKGSVENLIGFARRSFLVPIPARPDLASAQCRLACGLCGATKQRVMAGREEPIAGPGRRSRRHCCPCPPIRRRWACCATVLVRRTGHVRFQTNAYSVPVRYVGQLLSLRAEPTVRLFAGEEEVATHPRCYGRMQVIEDFRHYVPVLLEKPFAVPSPPRCAAARCRPLGRLSAGELVARSPEGNREFARLLALCLTYPTAQVSAALELARQRGIYSAEACASC